MSTEPQRTSCRTTMKHNKWESQLQIVSALAVLVGVVLVIVQLRQNADLLELQILKQDAESNTAATVEMLPDNIYDISLKSITDPRSLTQLDYMKLDAFLWSFTIGRWRGTYDLSENGLLEPMSWQRQVRDEARIALANPFGRAWWERMKNVIEDLPEELVEFVDGVLADASDNHARDAYMDVMNRMESASSKIE